MSHEDLCAAGLGHAFDPSGRGVPAPTLADITGGPDGQAGVIAACDSRVKRIRYEPDRQTWKKMPAAVSTQSSVLSPQSSALSPLSIYLGWYTAEPPTPADLARPKMLAGNPVQLADGNDWTVPLARAWIEGEDGDESGWLTVLPQHAGLDERGEWATDGVVTRYRRLWELACKYWDAALAADRGDDGTLAFEFAELNDAAVLALRTNYYIGRAEVSALGLFETYTARDVMEALIDMATVREWLDRESRKKKEAPVPAPVPAPDG